MRRTFLRNILFLLGALALGAFPANATAELIVNGGFEAGFTGWTRVDQAGGSGTFHLQTGTASPVNGFPVPAPPQGTQAAMSDGDGPGSHVLYQDFFVPTGPGLFQLALDLFIGNRDEAIGNVNPDFRIGTGVGLDFAGTNAANATVRNQQARIDIMRAGSDPFSVATADVLQNIYQTRPGDPLVSGYKSLLADISAVMNANLGQTLRLRFAEVDNVAPFQMGIDNVRIVPAPEPSSLGIFGLGTLLGLFAYRRRRNK